MILLRLTRFLYDGLGRVHSQVDNANNHTFYNYDDNSNVVKTIEKERDNQAIPVIEEFETDFSYDSLNRLVRATNSIGNRSEMFYDSRGNSVKGVDMKGNSTESVYDNLDRLISSIAHMTDTGDGTGNVIGNRTTSYSYYDDGQLNTVTDDNGNTTTYLYDALNRLVIETTEDTEVTSYSYDDNSNMVSMTDGNGSVITNIFDSLNRKTSTSVNRGSGVVGVANESYSYDGLGRLLTGSDEDTAVSLAYNSLNMKVSDTQNGKSMNYTFDAIGRVLDKVYPSGNQFDYGYTRHNLVEQVTANGTGYNAQTDFDYIGRRLRQKNCCDTGGGA